MRTHSTVNTGVHASRFSGDLVVSPLTSEHPTESASLLINSLFGFHPDVEFPSVHIGSKGMCIFDVNRCFGCLSAEVATTPLPHSSASENLFMFLVL